MPSTVRLVPCCLLLLLAALPSLGYPTGAPDAVCDNDLTPGHGKQGKKSNAYQLSIHPNDDGSFSVLVIAKGEPYFKGFVVQVRDKNGKVLTNGEWDSEDGKAISKCAAITHTSPDQRSKVELKWTPYGPVKDINFVATVLKEYSTYYKNIKGSSKGVPKIQSTTSKYEPEEGREVFEVHEDDENHQQFFSPENPPPIPYWALKSQPVHHQQSPWEVHSESQTEPNQQWDGAAGLHWQSEDAMEQPAVFQSHLPPPVRKAKRPTNVKLARRPISTAENSGSFEEPFTHQSQAFWAPVTHQHHIEHVQPQHVLRSPRFHPSQASQPQQVHQASRTQEQEELDAFFHQPSQPMFVPQPAKIPIRSHFRQQPRQRFRQAIRTQRFRPQRVQQQQHQQDDEEEHIDFPQQRAPTTRIFQTPTRFSFRRPVAFQIRHI